jgi:hypothetical protein
MKRLAAGAANRLRVYREKGFPPFCMTIRLLERSITNETKDHYCGANGTLLPGEEGHAHEIGFV